MNEWLRAQLKTAFLRRIIRCEKERVWCEFAIPGYCLLQFKECDYRTVRLLDANGKSTLIR